MFLSVLLDALIDTMPLRALQPIERSNLSHVVLPAASILSSEMLSLRCLANRTTSTIAFGAAINRLPTTKHQTAIETRPDTSQPQVSPPSCYTQLQPVTLLHDSEMLLQSISHVRNCTYQPCRTKQM